MALPRLNGTPEHFMNIPSTGEQVKFRPFLVKEEKVLLYAIESNDQKQIFNSIKTIIENCIIEPKINVNTLPLFDIEYIFLNLRVKSVGESLDVGVKCTSCEAINEVSVNLDNSKIQPEVKDARTQIQLTDTISLGMKFVSFQDLLKNADLMSDSQVTSTFEVIATCIDTVMTPDELAKFGDATKEEQQDFVDQLTTEQLKKIQEFVDQIPTLTTNITFNCSECGEINAHTLKGLDSFFA